MIEKELRKSVSSIASSTRFGTCPEAGGARSSLMEQRHCGLLTRQRRRSQTFLMDNISSTHFLWIALVLLIRSSQQRFVGAWVLFGPTRASVTTRATGEFSTRRIWAAPRYDAENIYQDEYDDDEEDESNYYKQESRSDGRRNNDPPQPRGRPRSSTSKRPQTRRRGYQGSYDDKDSYDSGRRNRNNPREDRRTGRTDFYDDEQNPYSRGNNQYFDEEDDDDDYYYDKDDFDSFDDDYTRGFDGESSYAKSEWEEFKCDAGTAHVLLPPLAVTKPTAILHFVGGTGFGSFPHVWYASLLQELVQHTNAAIVATSIPITVGSLWGASDGGRQSSMSSSSPLNHLALAKKLKQQFQMAYEEVIVDEYGYDEIKNVPICGLGHSLGSRLLTVLATLSSSPSSSSRRRQSSRRALEYKALILISFTNYGAAAGIPGIGQLSKASRQLQKREEDRRRDMEEESRRPRRSQRSSSRNKRRYRDDDYFDEFDDDDDDDEEYEDLGELFDDLKGLVQDQATQLQTALTPPSDDLEFYPSPSQLWKALTMDRRYSVHETLVIQFDNDEIDQSAKLAKSLASLQQTVDQRTLSNLNGDKEPTVGESANATISSAVPEQQVYFSRIRGTHLTPVVLEQKKKRGRRSNSYSSLFDNVNSQITSSMLKLLEPASGQRGSNSQRQQQESLLLLRQVVSSFLIETSSRGSGSSSPASPQEPPSNR